MPDKVDNLRSDIVSVGPRAARTSPELGRLSVTRRPRTRWLKSEDPFSASDDVPPPIRWQWNAFKTVDADPAWTRWWEAATHRRLLLAFSTTELSGDSVNVRTGGTDLHVSATSRAAACLYRTPKEPPVDQLHDALTELLRTTMNAIAQRLNMPPPPALPNLAFAHQLLGA